MAKEDKNNNQPVRNIFQTTCGQLSSGAKETKNNTAKEKKTNDEPVRNNLDKKPQQKKRKTTIKLLETILKRPLCMATIQCKRTKNNNQPVWQLLPSGCKQPWQKKKNNNQPVSIF